MAHTNHYKIQNWKRLFLARWQCSPLVLCQDHFQNFQVWMPVYNHAVAASNTTLCFQCEIWLGYTQSYHLEKFWIAC